MYLPKNYHLVEGPLGHNFTIRRVRPQDVDKVVCHIKDHFLHDEPISQMLGYSEVYGDEFCYIFKHFLNQHQMSFWIEDNATGDVAAVRAISLEFKDAPDPWLDFPRTCRASKIFYDIGEIVHEEGDLFERYQVSHMADLLLSSCAPQYRKQGLSKELYRRTLNFLKAEGVPIAKSVFTSPFSRAAVKPLGFEQVCRLYYKDVKDENGNLAFTKEARKAIQISGAEDDTEPYAALMALRII